MWYCMLFAPLFLLRKSPVGTRKSSFPQQRGYDLRKMLQAWLVERFDPDSHRGVSALNPREFMVGVNPPINLPKPTITHVISETIDKTIAFTGFSQLLLAAFLSLAATSGPPQHQKHLPTTNHHAIQMPTAKHHATEGRVFYCWLLCYCISGKAWSFYRKTMENDGRFTRTVRSDANFDWFICCLD